MILDAVCEFFHAFTGQTQRCEGDTSGTEIDPTSGAVLRISGKSSGLTGFIPTVLAIAGVSPAGVAIHNVLSWNLAGSEHVSHPWHTDSLTALILARHAQTSEDHRKQCPHQQRV